MDVTVIIDDQRSPAAGSPTVISFCGDRLIVEIALDPRKGGGPAPADIVGPDTIGPDTMVARPEANGDDFDAFLDEYRSAEDGREGEAVLRKSFLSA